MSEEIEKDEFYTTQEAADLVGTAPQSLSRRQMIQRHIRLGELPAKNVGGEKTQRRYLIRGKDLIEYKKAVMEKGGYTTK